MGINKKYSFKDFLDQKFTDRPASEFNNSEIVGSCFAQQDRPDTQVFPTGITEVTFDGDNLDNVFIPPANIIKPNCCHRKVMRQNDLEDWLVDNSLKPTEPRSKKEYLRLGISVDPKDIPIDFMRREMHPKAEWVKTKDSVDVMDWFIEPPQIISQGVRKAEKTIPRTLWESTSNKSKWIEVFDETPSIETGMSKDKEVVILKGNITFCIIEGKGVFAVQGKRRAMMNEAATVAKRRELAEVK